MTANGKVWLITGCSSGFGRAIAEAALAAGDSVVVTARRVESLSSFEDGERVLKVALDVTRDDQIVGAVEAAVERFGRVDVLVNNAGHGSVGAVEEFTMDELRDLFETMYFGAVALTKEVLPGMRERGSGVVVQISSMGGQVSPPGFGAYCSAKFALEAVSEALAAEVGPLGVKVIVVEPGSFRTEFGGGRLHRSREIAAYAETAGANRDYITGVDGTQPGDPSKAAAAIVRAVSSDDAPLHLALGDDAVEAIRASLERKLADLEAWEDVSRAMAL